MNAKKKGFVVYKDIQPVLERLSDEEAGKLIKGMVSYAADGKVPKFDGVLEFVFIPIKQQMDRDAEKYDQKCEKNRKKIQDYWDGVKANTNEYNSIPMNTTATDKDTNKDTDTDTKKDKDTDTTTDKNVGCSPDNDDYFDIWKRLSAKDRDAIYKIYPESGGFLIDEVYEEVKKTRRKVKDPVTYILGYARNKKWDDKADHFDY